MFVKNLKGSELPKIGSELLEFYGKSDGSIKIASFYVA
jgi:hypothetical protein